MAMGKAKRTAMGRREYGACSYEYGELGLSPLEHGSSGSVHPTPRGRVQDPMAMHFSGNSGNSVIIRSQEYMGTIKHLQHDRFSDCFTTVSLIPSLNALPVATTECLTSTTTSQTARANDGGGDGNGDAGGSGEVESIRLFFASQSSRPATL